ncbi:MAG TPA: phosphoribosyltransferase [Methanomassiliicoccales archaeon]|nr:phosphoribosyltransferase [Methanomassiliicoccales archaeon]
MAKVESFKSKIVTYDEISKWTLDVARQIEDCRCKPTVIIGLTRGGWVPARLLCDHLHVKKLYAVKTEHWGITANQDGKAILTQELNAPIENENVLIVDDITDTGESLKLAVSHIEPKRPKEIRTATLLHITHSKIEPEFYSVRVPEEHWTWFIFPWNLHEDLRTLLPKTLMTGRTEEEIGAAFKDQFQIDVSEDLVRTTLKGLEAEGKVRRSGRVWIMAV